MTTQEVVDALLSQQNIERSAYDANTGINIGQIAYYRELETNKRGFVGSVIVFIKRVIRKLVRFVVEPICIQQSTINQYYWREIEVLREELRVCKEQIDRLEHK